LPQKSLLPRITVTDSTCLPKFRPNTNIALATVAKPLKSLKTGYESRIRIDS